MKRIRNRLWKFEVSPAIRCSVLETGGERTKDLRVEKPALHTSQHFSKRLFSFEFDRWMAGAGDVHFCNRAKAVRLKELLDQLVSEKITAAHFIAAAKTPVECDFLQFARPG